MYGVEHGRSIVLGGYNILLNGWNYDRNFFDYEFEIITKEEYDTAQVINA